MLSRACWPWAGHWWFTGIKPQSHRAHGGRTDGDDYYSESICGSFQVLIIGKLARLCELCVSAVNNSSCIINAGGYGNKPQRRRARGGRTNGDDCYSEANMLSLSSAGNKGKLRVSVSSVPLWLIIVDV